MDIQKLRQAVFEKTGIRIDELDPVLSVVALNEVMFGDMLAAHHEIIAQYNGELDEKIGSLVVLHRKIAEISNDLVERANQAHLSAALKAAAEAKIEILNAARMAVSAELEKSVDIVTAAARQLTAAGKEAQIATRQNWLIGLVQGATGGIIGGLIVFAMVYLRQG